MSDHSLEDAVYDHRVDLNDLPELALTLGHEEVHLWQASLDSFSPESLEHILSEDEIIRARRFHFKKDRNHFMVARALLRKLLGSYLRSEQLLPLKYGEMGKPFLAPGDTQSIRFNLAHSGGRAIYAFSESRELGVDLECIREDTTGDDIANRFFSEGEINALHTVPADLRKHAFFNCWTRKEAYIKARGEGLSMPLDSFDVSLAPDEQAALLKNHTDEAEVARWEMRSIAVAPGFVAALVVEGHGWWLKTFELGPDTL